MKFSKACCFLFLVFPLAFFISGCNNQNTPPPYNVVLISVDTLRPDHLGCYGYSKKTSPIMDNLAKQGVLFENTISTSSWTLPAHMALFTSLYDSAHQVNRDGVRLDDQRFTMAEAFKEKGFATAGFFTGPYLHNAYGFEQGFETYEACMEYKDLFHVMGDQDTYDQKERARASLEIEVKSHRDMTSELLRIKATKWLDQNWNRSFFLFLHFFDAHYDFVPPPPYCDMFKNPNYKGTLPSKGFMQNPAVRKGMAEEDLNFLLSQYDGEIRWVDHNIGLILEKLKEYGVSEKTMVVVTSDHGEEFFEHGEKGHRKTLFDEVLKVPLLLRFPGKIPEARRVRDQCRIIDVFPTIMDLLGFAAPKETLGRSLVRLIRGEDATGAMPPAFSELTEIPGRKKSHVISLRTNRNKIIAYTKQNLILFYDLMRDPGEKDPQISPSSGDGKKMLKDLRNHSKTMKRLGNSLKKSHVDPTFELDDELKKRLKELDYLQD